MHLLCLNLEDLLLCLWRGTLKCEPTDDAKTWDWVKLVGITWEEHGQLVEDATQYFPSSFQHPPRNPAKKLSSGYKATEYYLYVFGLGPGLFCTILPKEYWENFCKLTSGIRILLLWSIDARKLKKAHTLLIQFAEEFENLYYQRREDRLHFCRPCVHTVATHAVKEVIRLGPGAYCTQFAMERTIGDLGQEVKQPSNPFANLSKRALRRAQVNALKAMIPDLDTDKSTSLPRGAVNMGKGIILLRPRERKFYHGTEDAYLLQQFGVPFVRCFGRLRLPNGQIARSLYVEVDLLKKCKPRNTRNVKLLRNDVVDFAEVWYYFMSDESGSNFKQAFAVVSVYDQPIAELLRQSSNALWACDHLGVNNLQVVLAEDIVAVVSMQPLPAFPGEPEGRWFVVEKPGIDSAILTGHEENMDQL
ncbi:hypothetical protein GGU11DRAFT_866628 [Lentinula aff. detonsa]|nr:hypothetical protein GGU11DRAFT_866628 [Lentinula aff. detonsa]